MSFFDDIDSAQPKTTGPAPDLIDGDFQARVVGAEFRSDVGKPTSKIAGKQYVSVELQCTATSGPNSGRSCRVMKMAVQGDEEGAGYFRGFLVLLGLKDVKMAYLQDVLNDPFVGPKGKVVELRARTKNGKQSVYLLRTLKDTDTPTPFDEPTAPAEDFPF